MCRSVGIKNRVVTCNSKVVFVLSPLRRNRADDHNYRTGKASRDDLCHGCISCLQYLVVLFMIGQQNSVLAVDDRGVDLAIVNALKFLSAAQRPNGSWEVSAGNESTAATSLAVMAFLAAGHVPGEGPYGQAIDRGIG